MEEIRPSAFMTIEGVGSTYDIDLDNLAEEGYGIGSKIWDTIVDLFCRTNRVEAKELFLELYDNKDLSRDEFDAKFMTLKSLAAEAYDTVFRSYEWGSGEKIYQIDDMLLRRFEAVAEV